MCDEERDLWVLNDEGLHRLQRLSGQVRRRWIREHRKLINEVIDSITTGKQRPHYLVYGD